MKDFGLYLVMTDPLCGYVRCAEAAVRAGVRMLQLRMKHVSRAEYLKTALDVRAVTAGSGTKLIVNDDPDVAVEAGADGVHLGQDDMDVAEARKRYPKLGIIGLSTHNPTQAKSAEAVRPDYIGVGPVFATPTKEIPDPVLGIETAAGMAGGAPFPAVAIGGINSSNLPAVLKAGIRNFAVVRDVCAADDPYPAIRRLQEILDLQNSNLA